MEKTTPKHIIISNCLKLKIEKIVNAVRGRKKRLEKQQKKMQTRIV